MSTAHGHASASDWIMPQRLVRGGIADGTRERQRRDFRDEIPIQDRTRRCFPIHPTVVWVAGVEAPVSIHSR